MIKKHLSFRIELTDKDCRNQQSWDKSDEFAIQFCKSFGLKTYSGTWSRIEIDCPKINEFVKEAKTLISNGIARFDGFCSMGFTYIGDAQWYQLFEGRTNILKDFIPDTDFAFWWQTSDTINAQTGCTFRSRTTYVSKRAKDILISNKVAIEEQFRPVISLEKLPIGAELLDGIAPLPIPYFAKFDISYEMAKLKNAEKRESPKYDDCRVLRMTHEGCTPIDEWSGIATFIYDMLLERDND